MATKKKNGRSKPRTAKQKAATRKLVALNKRRAAPKRKAPKRKAAKRSAPKRKSNKAVKPRKNVVSKKGLSKITSNPTLKKVLLAAGAVSVATSVAAVVAPQFVPTIQKPIVRAALGFVTGDFIGAAANFVIGGGAGQISGGSPAAANTGNIGFA